MNFFSQNTSGSNALAPKPNNSSSNVLVDNVNLITWQESPFPLNDVADSTVKPKADSTNKIETCDKETFTDPYDFNVAYVGGTEDYQVLQAFNRSINEPGRHSPDGNIFTNIYIFYKKNGLKQLKTFPTKKNGENPRDDRLVSQA